MSSRTRRPTSVAPAATIVAEIGYRRDVLQPRRTGLAEVCLAMVIAIGAAACAEGGDGGGGGGGDGMDAGTPPGPRDSGAGVDAFFPRRDTGVPFGSDSGIRPRDSGVRPRDSGMMTPRDSGGFPGFDGGGMMMGFCTSTAECAAMPGTCCFRLDPGMPGFCVPGMEMFGVCFPSE